MWFCRLETAVSAATRAKVRYLEHSDGGYDDDYVLGELAGGALEHKVCHRVA